MRLVYSSFVVVAFTLFLVLLPSGVKAVNCGLLNQSQCQEAPANLECTWDFVKSTCIVDPAQGAQGSEIEEGECNNNGDCEAGEACKDGKCVAKKGVGETCTAKADCKTDKCDFSGASQICMCTQDAQCGAGKICNIAKGVCETQKSGGGTCVVDADCLADYKCPTYAGGGICRKKCTKDDECGAEICFKNDYCVPKMKIGEPCTKESDCAVGKCMEGVCKDPAAFGGATPAPAPVQPSGKEVIENAISKIDVLTPPEMSDSDDLAAIVGKAINMLLGIIGSAALLVFLYSGIMWMTSGGADKTIANAQKSMIWAAIGLFTVFFSYILVKYIITQAGV